MITLCNTLLPNDRLQASSADIVEIFKPLPVLDKIRQIGVALIITIVSTGSKIVLRVFHFLSFFFDL